MSSGKVTIDLVLRMFTIAGMRQLVLPLLVKSDQFFRFNPRQK